MPAGELRERVAFDLQVPATSVYGTIAGPWEEQFIVAARIQSLRGGERVMSQRMTGVRPVIITVRSSTDTRTITTGWRARNTRNDDIYEIRAATPDERRAYIDVLAESGPAT